MAFSIREQGEANQWFVMDAPNHWYMHLKFNGELMDARQKEIAEQIAALPELLDVVRAMANFDGRNNNKHLKNMAREALAKINEARLDAETEAALVAEFEPDASGLKALFDAVPPVGPIDGED